MRVAHLLRKLDPAEWSGTETAVQRLLDGLEGQGVASVVFCPRLSAPVQDPLAAAGVRVERFRAFVPVVGLPAARKRQLVSVGGNLLSFDLLPSLWRERDLDVVHAHTLGRLGGIGLTVARHRRIPFVLTIHGGLLDLPENVRQSFNAPLERGFDWGKLFGLLFQSHCLLQHADALVTCNPSEARRLQEQIPSKRIVVQPHGIPAARYQTDHREQALAAFPQLRERQVLLCLGRLDPIKNQAWLLEQAPLICKKHPRALLVLAGPCTDEAYGEALRRRVKELGLQPRVLLTGALPPDDPVLVGLLQLADLLLLPSRSETFGLVLLEAWAAGTIAVAARASGPVALIDHGKNGWLFDLEHPAGFHDALDRTLANPALAAEMAARGLCVSERYSLSALAGRMKALYEELIDEKHALRNHSR